MNNNQSKIKLVKDVNPDGASFPDNFVKFEDKLYFTANDPEAGNELLVSDGTAEGTEVVADINPGDGDSIPLGITQVGDKLYFNAISSSIDNGEINRELWVSDGTKEGTNLVADLNPGTEGSNPSNLTELDGKLYFSADNGETGEELWISDGTKEGTNLVADLNPGTEGSNPRAFFKFDDKIYFSADNGETGEELWVSDGTKEGTNLVADLNPGADSSSITGFAESDGKLYFSADNGATGEELWVSDGTKEGTNLVADLNPGAEGSDGDDFVEFNNKLYFSANDGKNGKELWVSDGTKEGTNLVSDINPGAGSSNVDNLTEFDGKLYFSADNGETGKELWVSDGTKDGTQLLKDLSPAELSDESASDEVLNVSSSPKSFVEFNEKLYFIANNGNEDTRGQKQLWETDGTAEGTKFVEELYGGIPRNDASNEESQAASTADSFISELVVVGDELFFNANVDDAGTELYQLSADNGESANTDRNLNPSGSATPTALEGQQAGDSLVGETSGSLAGGDSDDLLRGGKNSLTGWVGNDAIAMYGGEKSVSDTFFGSAGSDVFAVQLGQTKDIVTDFELGSDKLGLSDGLRFEDLGFEGDTVKLGQEDLVQLNGINAENLSTSDFTGL